MYATTVDRGVGRFVGVVLVVILSAVAGTAVGTVLRDQFRADPGAPTSAEVTAPAMARDALRSLQEIREEHAIRRTASAAFSLDAIADLHALRADDAAAAAGHEMPASGQRKAASDAPAGVPATDPKVR